MGYDPCLLVEKVNRPLLYEEIKFIEKDDGEKEGDLTPNSYIRNCVRVYY